MVKCSKCGSEMKRIIDPQTVNGWLCLWCGIPIVDGHEEKVQGGKGVSDVETARRCYDNPNTTLSEECPTCRYFGYCIKFREVDKLREINRRCKCDD